MTTENTHPRSAGVVRCGPLGVSVRVYWPSTVLGAVLTLLAVAVAVVSLTLGDFAMGVGDVLAALTGQASTAMTHVVVELRLPRALTALGVGAALAMSGTLLQRLARNPLVSPDIIGISAGASAAALFALVAFGGTALTVAAGALAGAVGTGLALYLLAYQRGVTGHRMVLVGIAVTALLSSVSSYLMTRANVDTAQRAMVWLTGSLANRAWEHAATIAVALVVLTPVALALTGQLRLLQLGDETAVALGCRVRRARAGLLLSAAALAAMATAVAGPIAFVALVAPQIVRRLLGGSAIGLVPGAACGGLLVAGADLAARAAFGDGELPVGVVTGALGAPFLLYLLTRTNTVVRDG